MESQLAESIEISSPAKLLEVVSSLKDLISRGIIIETSGNCRIADIKPGASWPNDHIEIEFLEKATKYKFKLSCETYHGSGGSFTKMT